MKTATFTGDLIPDSVAGYAHYWLKMVVTETSSTSTDISGTVALYFCRNAESGAGYQFDNGNSLSVKIGNTSIYSDPNVCKLHINGGAASETLLTTINWSGTATGTFVGTTISPSNVFVYNGSQWKKGTIWVYDGTKWRKSAGKVSVNNGSAWKQ